MSQGDSPDQIAAARNGRDVGQLLSQMMREGRSFSSHERNCVYLNTGAALSGSERFANISTISGLDFPDDGRAVALTDWDHDGDLDIWISNRNAPRLRLMRNQQASDNHFLALRLSGNGTSTNRDAIGARVEVLLGEPGDQHRPMIKTLRAGEGFLAQSSKWLHFGLGKTDNITQVIVHWPGGETEQFSNVEVNQRYHLLQGSGEAQTLDQPTREIALVSSHQAPLPPSSTARAPLVELLPMPKSHYEDFNGQLHQLPVGKGRFLLVNLWASWCPACQVELKDFADGYEKLQSAGMDILALSVEGLEEDATSGVLAAKQFSKGKFPFELGLATSSLVSDFQSEHNRRLPLHKQLPLPTSFLIDPEGRLAVIYKGKISVDQLLEDVNHSNNDRHDRLVASSPIGGQSIKHPRVENVALKEGEFLRFNTASEYRGLGRIDEVARQYESAIRLNPDNYMAHSNLADALSKMGRNTEAISNLQRAIEIKPDEPVPYYNLANEFNVQGMTYKAVENYQRALELDPAFIDAHRNLAITLQGLGRLVEAISHFQQAIRIKPEDATLHLGLGLAYQAQGYTDRAQEKFEQALELDSKYAEAHNKLAVILQEQNKIDEAVKHYRMALELQTDFAEARFNMANMLHQQGKTAEAIENYQQVLDSMPNHPAVLTRLADAYGDEGNTEKAVNLYLQVLEKDPNFPMVLNSFAWTLATHPDAKWRNGLQAIALAERGCRITQNKMLPMLNTMAAAYAEAGRFDDAIRWQNKAIDLATGENKAELKERLELYKSGKPYRE